MLTVAHDVLELLLEINLDELDSVAHAVCEKSDVELNRSRPSRHFGIYVTHQVR